MIISAPKPPVSSITSCFSPLGSAIFITCTGPKKDKSFTCFLLQEKKLHTWFEIQATQVLFFGHRSYNNNCFCSPVMGKLYKNACKRQTTPKQEDWNKFIMSWLENKLLSLCITSVSWIQSPEVVKGCVDIDSVTKRSSRFDKWYAIRNGCNVKFLQEYVWRTAWLFVVQWNYTW